MTEATAIFARYFELEIEPDAPPDWILIKDRATGRAILAHCDDRKGCLALMRALNIADQAADQISA